MRSKKYLLPFFLAFLILVPVSSYGADDEESKVVKTADEIIKGLPAALKTGLDFSKMTPEQRIDFVISGVENKIYDDVAEKFKDQMKEKLEEYAKEAVRAKAFMDIGVPQIRHAYTMGQAFDWSKIDAQIASNVDTKMAAISGGLKAAEIGWNTIQAYREGDFTSAARTLGGSITEILAESYIPGYGYIKIGAELVEFLGNYVLDYATDTAVEGMLNDMYGKKSNPKALAQWLIDKSPQDIAKDINDKFNDGMGFGYVFRGQGTDKGDEDIMKRLQGELVSLRGQLLSKQKEQEQKEAQIKREIDNYLQKYRAAEAKVKAVAEAAKKEADKQLGPITEFKKKISALRKDDVKEKISEIRAEIGEVQAPGVAYVPLNYGSLVSEFAGIYSEVKETPGGSGYDKEAINRLMQVYQTHRREVIQKAQKANQDNCRKAQDQVNAQYAPGIGALASRASAEKDDGRRASLWQQYNDLNSKYQNELSRISQACQANNKKLGLESAALKEEENVIKWEAQERADRLSLAIKAGFEKIIKELQKARDDKSREYGVLMNEVRQKFTFPGLFQQPDGSAEVATCSGACGLAEGIKKGELQLYGPGGLHAAREQVLENIEKIKKDKALIGQYTAKEKEIIKRFQNRLLSLRREYESVVPKNLLFILQDTPEWAQNRKDEDERVKKYGSSAAQSETWGITWPPLVVFKDIPTIQSVDSMRYFDLQLSELEALEKKRNQKFDEGLQNLQGMLSTIDYYADLDRIAGSIMRLAASIDKVLGPYVGVYLDFRVKDGKRDLLVKAQDSDGAKKLETMKKAWAAAQPYVERMRKQVTAYGKGIKYFGFDQGPDKAIARLAAFEAVPGQIAAAEKRMADTEAQRLQSNKYIEDEIANLKDQFKSLQDQNKKMQYPIVLRALRASLDQIIRILHVDETRALHKDEYLKLRDDVEAYAKKRAADDAAALEAYQRQQAAESAAAKERERIAQEERNRESMRIADPLAFYGYKIVSARVNTYAVEQVSGDILVSPDKLIQGQIQIVAQLNHIDKAKVVLFSEDGGRSWKQVSLDKNINYAFTPIPNKLYNPMLQIKTLDGSQMNLKILPNANGILYKDGDYQDRVVAVIKAIADAYEKQDLRAFSELISRDYVGNKTFLEEGVRFDFDMFTDISLKLYINRIDQRAERFAIETRWDKTQTPRKTGQTQKTSGRTTIMLVMENGSLKIQNLRGDLIYATLSPEIAQASGLPVATVEAIRTAHEARNPVQPGAGTTDDSGGLGSQARIQTSPVVSVPGFPGTGFDFTANAEVVAASANSDADFEDDSIFGQNFQRMTGYTFESLTSAPASGYTSAGIPNDGAGAVYAFITTEGYYGKMEVISFEALPGGNLQFRFAVQTDGTTNLTTR